MDVKKLIPWNWFKKEEEQNNTTVPVTRSNMTTVMDDDGYANPLLRLHREMDRFFDNILRNVGLSPMHSDFAAPLTAPTSLLKPRVDIGATEKDYTITVEIPGVDQKDISVEIVNNTMTIRGEKKQEKEAKNRDYYRIERSYGAFQRVLSLPEDANCDNAEAQFKNGVLTVRMARKPIPQGKVKQIEIR